MNYWDYNLLSIWSRFYLFFGSIGTRLMRLYIRALLIRYSYFQLHLRIVCNASSSISIWSICVSKISGPFFSQQISDARQLKEFIRHSQTMTNGFHIFSLRILFCSNDLTADEMLLVRRTHEYEGPSLATEQEDCKLATDIKDYGLIPHCLLYTSDAADE